MTNPPANGAMDSNSGELGAGEPPGDLDATLAGAGSRTEELLLRWQELRDEGQLVTPEELCVNEPEQAAGLRRCLEKFQAMERLVSNAFGGESSHDSLEQPAVAGYEILGCLGRGGMGVVYRARHVHLKREVALKLILAESWVDPLARGRFLVEAEAIARLNHPNIVQIHEIGEHAGRPFFSLEYCRGGSLADRLRGVPLSARDAAALCEALSLGIQHAHERGIVHRDLKPGNVVLQLDDANQPAVAAPLPISVPKITDFGLARRLNEPSRTQADAVLGTPCYMSPEQARGSLEVGPPADVYSLGAILYETLTGRPPFRGATVVETIRQVLHEDPVAPRQLQPALPRDLETICLKALRKEPAQRYPSARALADDLRRFLNGEPVKARAAPAHERLYRWCRRHPARATALASAAMLAIVAGLFAWRNVVQARANLLDLQAEQRRTLAEQRKTTQALAEANRGLYRANLAQAQSSWEALRGLSAQQFLDKCPSDLRQWEWHYLKTLSDRGRQAWRREESPINALVYESEKDWLAACLEDGHLVVWNRTSGEQICRRQLGPGILQRLAFVSGGAQLAVVSWKVMESPFGSSQPQLTIVDLQNEATAPFTWRPRGSDVISDLSYCPKTHLLAVACALRNNDKNKGFVQTFDAAGFPPRESAKIAMPAAGCRFLALSPDGQEMAVAGGERFVYLLDAATGASRGELEAFAAHDDYKPSGGINLVTISGMSLHLIEWGVDRLAFSTDGSRLAAGLSNGQARIWDAKTRQLVQVLTCEEDHVPALTLSPDNRLLAAAATASHAVHVFDIDSGSEVVALQGHADRVTALKFTGNDELLTASLDGTIRKANVRDAQSGPLLAGHDRSVFGAAFSPSGGVLATGDANLFSDSSRGTIKWWDWAGKQVTASVALESGGVECLSFSPSGEHLAAACGDGKIRLWTEPNEKPIELGGHFFAARGVAWRPSGKELASVSGSLALSFLPGEAFVWDVERRKARLTLTGHSAGLCSVAYGPDGSWLATASADKTVRVWDAESGRSLQTLKGPHQAVLCLAIDPRGRWIAGGTGDVLHPLRQEPGEIYLWDRQSGNVLHVLKGHNQLVNGLAVTPDGRRLVSCSRNDKVRVWDAGSGEEILTLTPHDFACGVRFSPDGKVLVVPNWSGKINVYEAGSYRPLAERP